MKFAYQVRIFVFVGRRVHCQCLCYWVNWQESLIPVLVLMINFEINLDKADSIFFKHHCSYVLASQQIYFLDHHFAFNSKRLKAKVFFV